MGEDLAVDFGVVARGAVHAAENIRFVQARRALSMTAEAVVRSFADLFSVLELAFDHGFVELSGDKLCNRRGQTATTISTFRTERIIP